MKFDIEMYNNTIGSLVIATYITSKGIVPDVLSIKSNWRKLVKHPEKVNFWLDDPEFIDKALALFDMKNDGSICMVVGETGNCLFLPYIDDTVCPVREDGILPSSAFNGKIYPIIKDN